MEISTILSIISVAFLSSVSHCLGMCGGFVMAYSTKLASKKGAMSFIFSLGYHLARIFAYVVQGVMFGFFGSVIIFSIKAKGYLFFNLGIFLMILGIGLMRRGKILSFIENDKIFGRCIMPIFKKLSKKDGFLSFVSLGFLNGLIPCGVVYYFLTISITQANILSGALVMLIFGLSTLPAMLIFSSFIYNINTKFKSVMMNISSIIIIIYGVYLSYLGFMALK